MNAIKILQHIEYNNIENEMFHAFTYIERGSAINFVRAYFGGDFVSGHLEPCESYVAFWNGPMKIGVVDAVVTDDKGRKIYIYKVD